MTNAEKGSAAADSAAVAAGVLADAAAAAAPPLARLIARVPPGYSEARYRGARYGVTRAEFNGGRSVKIFARALDGSGVVSLNYYRAVGREWLRPCEMPAEDALSFLTNATFLTPDDASNNGRGGAP